MSSKNKKQFGVWMDAEAFQPERRTGALAPAAVEEARRKRRELEWWGLLRSLVIGF